MDFVNAEFRMQDAERKMNNGVVIGVIHPVVALAF
jgi:hypothetical protein